MNNNVIKYFQTLNLTLFYFYYIRQNSRAAVKHANSTYIHLDLNKTYINELVLMS